MIIIEEERPSFFYSLYELYELTVLISIVVFKKSLKKSYGVLQFKLRI